MDDLPNTLEQPGEFDALVKLRSAEPYFLLLGRDRLAPKLVDDWADANRKRALADFAAGTITTEKRDLELRQSTQAEMLASDMRQYKAAPADVAVEHHKPKAEQRPTYTGFELPADTARRDEENRVRARAVAVMHDAVAELTEQAALLDAHETFAAVDLRRAIEHLNNAVRLTMPARPIPGAPNHD